MISSSNIMWVEDSVMGHLVTETRAPGTPTARTHELGCMWQVEPRTLWDQTRSGVEFG